MGTTAAREGRIAFEADWSIRIVEPDGSGLRVLAKKGERSSGEGDGYLYYPSFTLDGSRVTYVNGARTTHQDVVVRRVAGGGPKLFAVDGYLLASPLSFSPDGASVAVSRYEDRPGQFGVYVLSTRGRKERQLTGFPFAGPVTKDTRPDWSPDGRSIVFSRLQRGNAVLMVVRPSGGGPLRRLIRGAEPDWEPSGQQIAFVRRDGLYVCRLDGTGVRRIVAAVGASSPDFAPDGSRLAYAASGSVWVVSSSGGVPVKIADGVDGQLDWG